MSGDKSYSGWLFLDSNSCNAAEYQIQEFIQDTTDGQSSMNRWDGPTSDPARGGIDLQHMVGCDNAGSPWWDIRIEYYPQALFLQPDGSYIGGRNLPHDRLPSECLEAGVSYPCGDRPIVQINQDKYWSNSLAYQQRLLMHETSHSIGLGHHCGVPAVANQGGASCPWLSLSPFGYQATDRQGVSNVYP